MLGLTPPEVQSLTTAFKHRAMGSHCEERNVTQLLLRERPLGTCYRLPTPTPPRSGCGWGRAGSQEPKPGIAQCSGPCSPSKMILAKEKLRLKAITAQSDASLLRGELVLWLVCPIPMCPLTVEQLSGSLPSSPVVHCKRRFC